MKTNFIFIILAVILVFVGCNKYNSLATLDQGVKAKWSDVENQYQRRSDLIPNLVATVKGAANFEQSTLTAVVEARSKATSIRVDPKDLTPEKLQEFQNAQGQLSQALGRLMMVTENYPELKATQGFSDLRVQLEGCENRITVSRKDFNDSVKDFNSKLVTFPNNILGGMFGFKEKGYFQAKEGSDKVPEVKF
ncbi:MAG: LemA family protein [Saprospiraceae bacterium]|jgi:LemA protein|nr:LemA family protein [Saprospiraceae bacterium]